MTYDVIVIGGGPSGLMAAISAAEHGAHTLLLEKGKKLGKKLAISGGGRCNVTNRLPEDEVIKHIPGNGKFLYSAFSVFNNYDIIEFFENLGVALKEEDHGRMFPVSNSAASVVNTLIDQLNKLEVDIRLNAPVKAVDYGDTMHKVYSENGDIFETNAIVIAVGGKAVPHTGSNGEGYPWAKKAGHTITTLFPTEVPLTSSETFIKERTLQGLALRDVAVSVLNKKGKIIITHQMDMLFTHFGVSGPAILRCSQFAVKELMKEKTITLQIDALPNKNQEEIRLEIENLIRDNPKRTIKNSLKGIVPERYLQFLFDSLSIDDNKQGNQISNENIRALAQTIKQFSFEVDGSLPMKKAFVTGGGVSIKEIVPNTMQSKLMEGLFFCGEILDIHGYTGGYNITSALVTGRLAGMNAAWS
ncbi:NAD(P)/FAD-dependent oxidoreductase [Oceanobacillus alkalisoli]|uniref:NAD(P)/FAD-dependent oxidoreductase n=1 Tax=Oceanobacillus alkalisoli TaxID=2925113 RepID=UPI001F11CF52|nr:NAD(P)/FAD-dependent oxidoreductase [Oceanobacillus alkalisoli]MCF3944952.1 NAD(P)/FAD-dependent oxidoreductase [Oceanobacillus alkalisoli]